MSRAFIIAARRTAVAPRRGALAKLEAWQLAAPVLQACLADAGVNVDEVDEVILGNALSGGGNVARLAALAAGLPERVSALSIDRQCCSGLDAIMLAARLIEAGAARVVLAGGTESWSRSAIRAHRPRREGEAPDFYDTPPFSPWPERDPDMVEAAAELARTEGITRAAQDAFAVESHRKALVRLEPPLPEGERDGVRGATATITRATPHPALSLRERTSRSGGEGVRQEEIVLLPEAPLAHDAFARNLTPRLCARAPILAGTDEYAIDAATVAVEADAAAAVLVVAEDIARAIVHPLEILDALALGSAPEQPAMAIVPAVCRVLARNDLDAALLDHVELMEAFAVQALANIAHLGLDPARVNPGGGALSRGHPVGASGAILAVRLFHEMRSAPGAKTGLAAIAAAGGLATAMLLRSNE
ncbi:thiolase family protein [Starkeya sp. ORNL1]|uniref:thiolase family protein n=1 Tax=Starkeya sp. ORNL1 TaxID=2709380 RepID=UPI001463E531|nr:thiolase family protein [Starkeya sp. ORNL1]QJP14469.1 thiolase family protein [Starkeya sp. ORNL1]